MCEGSQVNGEDSPPICLFYLYVGKVSPADGVDPEDEDEDEDDRLLVPDQTGGIVVAPVWREI